MLPLVLLLVQYLVKLEVISSCLEQTPPRTDEVCLYLVKVTNKHVSATSIFTTRITAAQATCYIKKTARDCNSQAIHVSL